MASLAKVDEEIQQLTQDIMRLGIGNSSGQYEVEYGTLFDDEKVEQYYEALMGTLKAAKKQGVVAFEGQMLLKGAHDKVKITLTKPPEGSAPPPTPEGATDAPTTSTPAQDTSEDGGAEDLDTVSEMQGVPLKRASTFKPRDPKLGPPTQMNETLMNGFKLHNESDVDEQCEFFLKSFIFALGDNWKDVPALLKTFRQHAKDTSGGANDTSLNHIQASDFLQHHGKTRTGMERKAELNDVDIDNDGQISFTEYLLLHYKVMILQQFYKRYEIEPVEDLSNDGIGVVGVGFKLVDEYLTIPRGMDPALEAAIESFTEEKKAREKKVEQLEAKAAAGGVKGMAAKNELIILEQADQTELNRIELTLMAARRRADKRRGSELLSAQKAKAEAELKKAHDEQRARMAARRAMFEKK